MSQDPESAGAHDIGDDRHQADGEPERRSDAGREAEQRRHEGEDHVGEGAADAGDDD